MGRLDGKVAIITGATNGMGRAAAELFAKEGAQVVAVGTNAQRLQSLRDLNNPAIAAIRGDVSSAEDWDQIVRFARERFGKINILVNNAGLSLGPHGVMDTTPEEWDRNMNVDLKGCWLGMKAVVPELIRQGGGSIINTSSTGGLMGGICDGAAPPMPRPRAACGFSASMPPMNLASRTSASTPCIPARQHRGQRRQLQPGGGRCLPEPLAAETPLGMIMAEPIDIAYLYCIWRRRIALCHGGGTGH